MSDKVPHYEDLEAMRRYGEATRKLIERLAEPPLEERGFGPREEE